MWRHKGAKGISQGIKLRNGKVYYVSKENIKEHNLLVSLAVPHLTIDALVGLDTDNQLIPHTLTLDQKMLQMKAQERESSTLSPNILSSWPWRCLQAHPCTGSCTCTCTGSCTCTCTCTYTGPCTDLEDVSRHVLVLDPDLSLPLVQSLATLQDEGNPVPPGAKGQGLKLESIKIHNQILELSFLSQLFV